MSSPPLVSIVTLTKNNIGDLRKTMLSVLKQRYPNMEYFVINGGGLIDNEIADILLLAKSIKIQIINGVDSGIYNAMNFALNAINGEWVNFMNSGDQFVNSEAVDNAFKDFASDPSIKVMRLHDLSEAQKLFEGYMLKNICQQAIFYNKKKLKHHLFFDETYKYSADLEALMRIYFHDTNAFAQNCLFSIIEYQAGGVSGLNSSTLIIEKKDMLKKYKKKLGIFRFTINLVHLYLVKNNFKWLRVDKK